MIELTEGQRSCCDLVRNTQQTFVCNTSYWPKTMYASKEFFNQWNDEEITELEIYGVSIGLDKTLQGFACYAFRAQLVD